MRISAKLEIDSEELSQAAQLRAVTITFPLGPSEPLEQGEALGPSERRPDMAGEALDAGGAPPEGKEGDQPTGPLSLIPTEAPQAAPGDMDAGPAPSEGQPSAPPATMERAGAEGAAEDMDAGPAPGEGEGPGMPQAPVPPGAADTVPQALSDMDGGPAPSEDQAPGTGVSLVPAPGQGEVQVVDATDAGPGPGGGEVPPEPQVEANAQDAGSVPHTLLGLAAAEMGTTDEAAAADDLTVIDGVGRRIARVLEAAGIVTFEQLAAAAVTNLRQILSDAGIRARPDLWPEQARLLAAGR